MGQESNDLLSLGASAIAVVLILRLVFYFVISMKANRSNSNVDDVTQSAVFSEEHAQSIVKIEYQVNEMYSGLQVNKELQRALASIVNTQEQQTAILIQLTKLTASSQKLLGKIAGNKG